MANPTPRRLQGHQQLGKDQRGTNGKEFGSSFPTAVLSYSVSTTEPSVRKLKQSRVASLLTIALLLSGAGLVTGGLLLSIQLFSNPDAVIWLNQLLPEWGQIPQINPEQPQTLAQIREQLSQQGKITGEAVPLETDSQTSQATSLVLPVLSSIPQCQIDCEQIVELRVYQLASIGQSLEPQSDPDYQLVSRVAIQGPAESFAIAPLLNAESGYQGSNTPLPLTEVHRFEGTTPALGIWLYLQGHSVERGTAIAYGYVLHYNPSHSHLSLMLPWTSPKGEVPQWQKVTAGDSPELVIDQTIDLEPQLHVYQVKPAKFFLNPLQLEPISLAEPALDSPAYQDAILIARNGLWSPAYSWLQYIKQQQPWSAAAQAQMDLIRLYAQQTQNQAEQTWASPTQQVMAELIDGRWGEGLQVFQASPENTQEIATLLKTDSGGRIWNRVEVALQVNPQRPEVKAWGALIVAAQQGQKTAIAWLKQQPKTTPATVAYIQPLLKRLDGVSTTSTSSNGNLSRIVGTNQ